MKKNLPLTKPDIFLLCFLVLMGAILSVFIFTKNIPADAHTVEISVNGTVTARYPLDEECEETIHAGEDGYNTFVIKNQTVWVKFSNCRDKTCQKTRAISHPGEYIVCLPHRIVITITGEKEDTAKNFLDAVAK